MSEKTALYWKALCVIQKALDKDGVKGEVSISAVSDRFFDHWIVKINGKYFGIYDVVRDTWTD